MSSSIVAMLRFSLEFANVTLRGRLKAGLTFLLMDAFLIMGLTLCGERSSYSPDLTICLVTLPDIGVEHMRTGPKTLSELDDDGE